MKRISAIILCVVCGLAAMACARVYSGSDFVFNSEIPFSVRLYGKNTEKAYGEMQDVMTRLTDSVSTTNPDSVISKVNAAAVGERVEVDEIFFSLAKTASELYAETAGAFNVMLAPLSRLWQVDAESIHLYAPTVSNPAGSAPDSLPAASDVAALLQSATPASFTLEDDDGYYITKSAPVEFDFGGLAKGWAVDRCTEIANRYGMQSAKLDLSGNLVLLGQYYDDRNGSFTDWTVGITDPRPDNIFFRGYVMAFESGGGESIVTSGDYERYYMYSYEDGAVRVPHIIGKQGFPIGLTAAGDRYEETAHVISATVIGASSMLCDAYATAVSVMGLEEGAAFLASVGYKGIIFTSDNRMKTVGTVEIYDPQTYDGYKAYTAV